ncbi:MAG: class I SAM-dependent methyltransferase [Alphaproteobacteria bacterium]
MGPWDIVFLVIILFTLVCLSYFYYERKTGVPTFPTMPAMRNKVIEVLRKEMAARPGQPFTVIDLGSGSGQATWHIAKALPEAQIIGIELSFVPWLRSVIRQKLFGPANLEYKRVDFLTYDISQVDAVFMYLVGKIMERVSAKLRAELKPGALAISNKFPLPGWEPYDTAVPQTLYKTVMLLYRQGGQTRQEPERTLQAG